MKLRSLLFVPGDRPERFKKAINSSTDAVILDLEDSVTSDKKGCARDAVSNCLSEPRAKPIFIRINPLKSKFIDNDLLAILDHQPDGIILPKCEGASNVLDLVKMMSSQTVPILPIATETPVSIFEIGSLRHVSEHLCGITWGAEDLPAAIGASASRDPDGSYTSPYEFVRNLSLFAAHAANVLAIDTVFPDIKNQTGLMKYATRGYQDGFKGMMAIHPSQTDIINKAYTPSEIEIAYARKVIDAFSNNKCSGAIQLDGQMLDAPHLKQAQHCLSLL
ncbi:HpcH/HpaI aldolase/citrate lyase family protein [Hirschia baltica]|uniref:Citrate (Pro-3S)-lyase n=1 Tax=Hirschia baltica (strain ATCC 49814 / DSM 5838 / IFAM 1418) TaxID=582402 RepID=C6XP66_HIRBI|nr:CoA ester lyase [Hirschia baltica]ACT60246.1 Citrate (pro-3S)-lyase [Hirschia baltica ATCC 49814]